MEKEQFLKLVKSGEVKFVDVRFCDLFGVWQHFTLPADEFDEEIFEEGIGFDGSSIRGWQTINLSDMIIFPDPKGAFVDPFFKEPTLVVICEVVDPITKEPYTRDPRYVAKKAEAYMQSLGVADTAYLGPELEFFIFDDVKYGYDSNYSFHQVDSIEGWWNSDREEMPNLGHKIPAKRGYFPVPPMDQMQDIRSEMVLNLREAGVRVEVHHHEVATAGQGEIDMRFAPLVEMADQVMKYKYILKGTARKFGKTVTFMPKPLFEDNGTGMHTHLSLWKDGKPLFAGHEYAGLSELALYFIGGVLKHARAICAFSNPTTNSYKRLVPGFEAPVNLAYSARNRSAAVRVPMYSPNPKTKRIEIRFPDPTACPYLAFAAMLMAGLDGIQNKIDPGEPLDKDIYSLTPEELAGVPTTPASLEEALNELEADCEFLKKGDVFTDDLLETYISFKRENEVDAIRLRPHPYEFFLYFEL